VTGPATAEAVLRVGALALTLGKLDGHPAAPEGGAVLADGILGIPLVLKLEEGVATLDVNAGDATVAAEDVLNLAGADVVGQVSNEQSHFFPR